MGALFRVAVDGPGAVSTMAKPQGWDRLANEMAALRTAGVDVLVSALTTDEATEAGLTNEDQLARAAGLTFVSIPIQDMGLPNREEILPTLQNLAADLRVGAHVVTHCWAGIGRSSLLAAALLVLNGIAPDDAWQRISTARGRAVPETPAQRSWIFDLS